VIRRDAAQAAAVGIAAVTAVLVAGGLLLHVFDALDSAGWVVVALIAAAAGALAAAPDPARLALPVLLATVALGLTVGGVALSRSSAADQERETRFTQLWLVERGSGGRAELGVRNEERTRTEYRLRLFNPASRGVGTLLDRRLVLGPSQSWSQQIALPRTRSPERVNAELYRAGERDSHRSAHAWTSPRP
jgi:hypothetical protein